METTPYTVKSKEYETIYILRPDVDADSADKVQGRVAEVIARDAGKLVKVEQWGRRRLAYPLAKQRKGVYVYVKYVGRGPLVSEVERNLKLQDAVLKFQTVQTGEAIDIATVTVDPEAVKFQRLDLGSEPDEVESREKQLGLDVQAEERRPRPERSQDDDYADEDDEPANSARPSKEDE